jgi:hypothetical protein
MRSNLIFSTDYALDSHIKHRFPLIFRENPFSDALNLTGNVLELGPRLGVNKEWVTQNTKLRYYGYEPRNEFHAKIRTEKEGLIVGSLKDIPTDIKFDVIFARNFLDCLISASGVAALDEVTQDLVRLSKNGCLWIFLESEMPGNEWIDDWTSRFGIYPDVYMPVWNVPGRCSLDQLCLGKASTLMIHRRR